MASLDQIVPNYPLPSILIWQVLRQQLEAVSPEFREFLTRNNIHSYPDGTVYIEGKHLVLLLYELLLPHRRTVRMRENTHFRPLLCFNPAKSEDYKLFITDEYFQNIGGEQDFGIYPSHLTDPDLSAGEINPESLVVSIRFWGGLRKAARPKFFQAMIAWADSVGTEGVFGEGPAYLFPESFLFSRKMATFRIDVRNSGQHTVNWLALSILNFAAKGDYVSRISFGEAEDAEKW